MPSIVFGAAGSAKLAHALGMHGLQVLGLLAIGLGMRPPPTRTQVGLMVLAAAGYASVFAAVTATAYAGRAWTSPTVPLALLTLFGVVAVLAPSAVVAGRLVRQNLQLVGPVPQPPPGWLRQPTTGGAATEHTQETSDSVRTE